MTTKDGNLVFDLDNTKYWTSPWYVDYINQKYSISSTLKDFVGSPQLHTVVLKHLPKETVVTKDQIYWDLGTEFLTSHEWHKDVKPMPDMPEVTRELAKKYWIWDASAREKKGAPVIEALNNRYIKGCVSGNHFAWDHLSPSQATFQAKKIFVASLPGITHGFVDDTPGEVLDMIGTAPSFLFDTDDYYAESKEFDRFRSWRQIGDYFLN